MSTPKCIDSTNFYTPQLLYGGELWAEELDQIFIDIGLVCVYSGVY